MVPGLDATFERQSEKYDAQVRKVYPEVRDGKFQADFKFEGQQPDNIRTGQTYYLNLQLGQPERAVLIPRGTFYQKTGGKWIYVVSKDGGKAVKREIRIGRQNPQFTRSSKDWSRARRSSPPPTTTTATAMCLSSN